MRYSQKIKNKARLLRTSGHSLLEINQKINVPISTICTWINDIKLSDSQQERLKAKTQSALQAGRELIQQQNRIERIMLSHTLLEEGKVEIEKLTRRELFLIGVALYWAEGFKTMHERRLGFCNSDPTMIKFYLNWLEKVLGIKKEDVVLRVTLNMSYKEKTNEIQDYWANLLGISLKQFTKPFYQQTQWKKQYNTDNYYGVLRVHVNNSLNYLLKMRGWIEGLRKIAE